MCSRRKERDNSSRQHIGRRENAFPRNREERLGAGTHRLRKIEPDGGEAVERKRKLHSSKYVIGASSPDRCATVVKTAPRRFARAETGAQAPEKGVCAAHGVRLGCAQEVVATTPTTKQSNLQKAFRNGYFFLHGC